jgi:hypothetical protein
MALHPSLLHYPTSLMGKIRLLSKGRRLMLSTLRMFPPLWTLRILRGNGEESDQRETGELA